VLASISLGPVSCQNDCAYPTDSDLENVIMSSIPTGDNPATPTVNVLDFHPVCLAYSQERDRYRFVSVVVQYNCTGNADCPSGTAVEQFDSQCSGGTWSHSVQGDVDNTRTENPTANFSTTTRENCSLCLSPATAAGFSLTTDNVTHCVGKLPTVSQCCSRYNREHADTTRSLGH